MPNRLLRTSTVASIADFGAQPGNPGAAVAVANAQAFRRAFDAGYRRIVVPEGQWYFREIAYNGDPWLPPTIEIFGVGSNLSILRYAPAQTDPDLVAPALWFFGAGAGGTQARSTIRDLALLGPVPNAIDSRPIAVGISFDRALHCRVRDVLIANFAVGVDFNSGDPSGYSGYNVLERFEINTCVTGIRARDATNGDVVQNGRIFYSLYQDTGRTNPPVVQTEEGIGIDIEGTTSTFGRRGASGFLVTGVQVETAAICVRVVNSRDTTISGGYFETDTPPAGLPRRRIYDIAGSVDLVLQGNAQSEGGVGPLPEEAWTPSYLEAAPEDRTAFNGASIASASDFGTFVTGFGSARSGATAPYANRIRNGDMSRGLFGWSQSGSGLVTPNETPFVTGGASTGLQVVGQPGFHILQDISTDTGVRAVTVGVRYQLVSSGPHAFRIHLHDLDANVRLAHHTDQGPGPTGWRVRTLTGQFDQVGPGIVGPRGVQVRLYPYNGAPIGLGGQQVLVDSVWLVDGEYGPPYRAYTEGAEVLRGNDREVFFGGTTTSDVAPTGAMPSFVPANAIGMVVEMQVRGSAASAFDTILRVDDNEGADQVRDIHAFINNRPTIVEYTLPVTLGATMPQWSVLVGDPSNTVVYAVRPWVSSLRNT